MSASAAYAGPERRLAGPSPLQIALAALAAAAVAFATLCPIALRPHFASADLERFCAYAVLGVLVARAAGRRALAATAIMVLLAVGLEFAQRFVPGRHATVADAAVKALGGVAGAALAELAYPLRRLLARGAAAPRAEPEAAA
jgi:hypothetical protein